MAKNITRTTPHSLLELTAGKRAIFPALMSPEEMRLLGERSGYAQEWISNRLRKCWESKSKRQWPLELLHKEMRRAGLYHCQVNIDPPNWIDVWEYSEPPRKVKDKYGRLLYMDKGKKELKRIKPEDFAPMPAFEAAFPMHPDPANATREEKEKRIAAFLNAYAASGLVTASAMHVGVNYFQLVLWINEDETWRSQLIVAEEAAKLVMVDVAKTRAMRGDGSLLRFFVERDNPEKYGRIGGAKKKDATELPEGVTHESVASALAMIKKAQGEAEGVDLTAAATAPAEDDGAGLPAALVNQTSPPPETFNPSSPGVKVITIEGSS